MSIEEYENRTDYGTGFDYAAALLKLQQRYSDILETGDYEERLKNLDVMIDREQMPMAMFFMTVNYIKSHKAQNNG